MVLFYSPVISNTFSSYGNKLVHSKTLNNYRDNLCLYEIIPLNSKTRFLNSEKENLSLLEIYYLGNLYYKISTIFSWGWETSFMILYIASFKLPQTELVGWSCCWLSGKFVSYLLWLSYYFCILSSVSNSHHVSNRLTTGKLLPSALHISEKGLLNIRRFHFTETPFGKYTRHSSSSTYRLLHFYSISVQLFWD